MYDDPYIVYKVQSAGTTAQTNIGNCADVVAGAGSTTTGQSGFEISASIIFLDCGEECVAPRSTIFSNTTS